MSRQLPTIHHDLTGMSLHVADTTRLEYLIMDKLFLHKYYLTPDVHLLMYNVVGYLASSPSRVELYEELAVRLIHVWADTSSIRY